MRSLRSWWRNLKHSLGDCPGAWSIDVERHVATCHFCGFEDHYDDGFSVRRASEGGGANG